MELDMSKNKESRAPTSYCSKPTPEKILVRFPHDYHNIHPTIFKIVLSTLIATSSLFFVCSDRILRPGNPEFPISYSGKTNQDQFIGFVVDNNVITQICFSWKTSELGKRRSSQKRDTLTIISENRFTYSYNKYDNSAWAVSGEYNNNRFSGIWATEYPPQNGTWTARTSKFLATNDDTLFIEVGRENSTSVFLGVEPFSIIQEPDSAIATITSNSWMVENGSITIKGISEGETELTIGDSSLQQLTVSIILQVYSL